MRGQVEDRLALLQHLMAVHYGCLNVPAIINEVERECHTGHSYFLLRRLTRTIRCPPVQKRIGRKHFVFVNFVFTLSSFKLMWSHTIKQRRIRIYRTDDTSAWYRDSLFHLADSHFPTWFLSRQQQRFVVLCSGIDLYKVQNVKTAVLIRVCGERERSHLLGSQAFVLLWGTFPFWT